ncbi:MAG: AfsR/SARP family transcriptional regulator, partial [Leptospirillia bacterium]
MLDLRLLGSPGLFRNGEPVRLFKKSLALLTFLSMEQARPHERVSLSELFWPDLPKARADNSLRLALHSLRKALDIPNNPSLIFATRTHVAINQDRRLRIDVQGLVHPPASCPIFHDPENCPFCKDQMVKVILEIRGPFMEGFSLPQCEEFENWMTGRREEFQVRVRWSVNRLIRLYEKRGTPQEALAVLSG